MQFPNCDIRVKETQTQLDETIILQLKHKTTQTREVLSIQTTMWRIQHPLIGIWITLFILRQPHKKTGSLTKRQAALQGDRQPYKETGSLTKRQAALQRDRQPYKETVSLSRRHAVLQRDRQPHKETGSLTKRQAVSQEDR